MKQTKRHRVGPGGESGKRINDGVKSSSEKSTGSLEQGTVWGGAGVSRHTTRPREGKYGPEGDWHTRTTNRMDSSSQHSARDCWLGIDGLLLWPFV